MGDPYYRFFVGDYIRDTVGLTMMQDGAYRRLLDHAYSGTLIPDDPEEVYRLARAMTDAEKDAVNFIINRYFRRVGDKIVNARVEKELVARRKFLLRQSEKGKRSAAIRWGKSDNHNRLFQGRESSESQLLRENALTNIGHAPVINSAEGGNLKPPNPQPKSSNQPSPEPFIKNQDLTSGAAVKENPSWPAHLKREQETLQSLGLMHSSLADPEFWDTINQWIESTTYEIYTLDELKKYIAWLRAQTKSRQHKNLKRGFRNWLSTRERWEEQSAQRKAAKPGPSGRP